MNKRIDFFSVNVNKYNSDYDFVITHPASLNNPKNNSVMFIMETYMSAAGVFEKVNNCLIFWPENIIVPQSIMHNNAVIPCCDPHIEYCRFFSENNITYYPASEKYKEINGAYIAENAVIGRNATIMPGVYIGGDVTIGDNAYIGCGTKIIGAVTIGDNVVIRENTVIGADGLSTDRDSNGQAVTMPQFGSVVIEDNVQIGANTVIGRGAIDETVIETGSKIDNSCFISHNVHIGRDTFIVGESIMFGSSSTGDRAFISGNSTIRNGVHIGNDALVGMGSVVVKPVPDGAIVKGNPAKQ